MARFTLYIGNKNYSSWSLRGWLACKQAGIAFEEVVIPLREADTTTAIREVSPSGRVPALRDGDITIWDSLAIGEYLAELYPAAGLWPADRAARAHARAISAEIHSGFAALRKSMPMNIRRALPGRGQTPESLADIARIVEIWRQARARFGKDGPFLFGALSFADAMFAPVVTRLTTYAPPLSDDAKAYMAAMWSLPAMQAWRADSLEESWVIPAEEIG
jgi:glutathione S-transferase